MYILNNLNSVYFWFSTLKYAGSCFELQILKMLYVHYSVEYKNWRVR